MRTTTEALVLRGEAGGVTFALALAVGRELSIGRAADADLRVNIPDASRQHAKLRIQGSSIQICDVGSTNGTFVRSERLASGVWTDLRVSEPFAFGERMLVIQTQRDSDDCDRLTGRELFEERVREELATFERTSRPFGVCIFDGLEGGEWLDAMAAVLSTHDVVAVFAETTIAVLLVGRTQSAVTQFASEFNACMERRRFHPVVQCVFCPETGTTLERLLPRGPVRADPNLDTVRPAMHMQHSGAMSRVYAMVAQVAPTSTSVMIYGATGTGKDVLAHEIHQRSRRKNGPFVALNCAALPENLLESELFGYEKGAFTGAVGAKPGQFELAHGGTLFLDEIGEMPLLAQAKLLRVVEERAVLRLGGTKLSQVDVRIIAATNRDLRVQIEAARFRADLFYRLNGFSITLPLLRERTEEIPFLVDHFVSRAASALGKSPPVIAPEVMSLLIDYDWPGNIRELRSVVERAVLLSRHGFIRPEHLPDEMVPAAMYEAAPDSAPPTANPPFAVSGRADWEEITVTMAALPSREPPSSSSSRAAASSNTLPPLDDVLAINERHEGAMRTALLTREVLAQALDRCGGNQTEVAKLLGVSRRTVINRIKKFGMARPRKGGTVK